MHKYLNRGMAALLLAGTALCAAGAASADDNRYGNDQPNVGISVQFGDVTTGYRDGYWDNHHNWHRWNSDGDYQSYRAQHADSYRDYNHDRDSNGGAVAVSFGDVSVGYRDGYMGNDHHFHNWSNDGDYQTYRSQHGDSYRDYNHDRDGNNGAIAVSFGDVSMGYRDGYMGNDRHFHNWNNDGDYRAYRSQHGDSYRDYNHDRDGNDGAIAVSFGDVSMGYRDGYWDNGHRWHHWDHDGDWRSYRDQHRDNYRDYNHDRYNTGFSIGLGNIAFGYRDGYWDSGHHWHHWRHRHDYRDYRDQNGSNYHDWNHNRDGDHGWQSH